jgi:dipeptidyl aminopeptidase/acylaminoacyl peptidase
MEKSVSFESADGLTLSGTIHTPDDLKPGEQRPAFIVLHGFGSNSSAANAIAPASMLCDWGYITLRFDMRGCGKSDGEFGRILCLDQVEDTQHALSFFRDQPGVMPDRIGLIGSSFGAAVSIYTAGIDDRVAAVVSAVAWGNGETKFQAQHSTPDAWKKFTDMLAAGPEYRQRTGESMMVSRYDIVPIPEHLRGHLATKSVMEFPVETAQSMFDFKAEEVIGNIAPRPVLLMHAAKDSVCPTSQSIELFKRAGQPSELHLLADVDHFMFAEGNVRARDILSGWLQRYFPLQT